MLHGYLSEPGTVRALVIAGEPGIGKTTLWGAGVDAARERGLRVLSARPAEAEARLSFAGLADLFEEVETEVWSSLPAPQKRALEIALLRSEPMGSSAEPRAIAAAALGALRAMASAGPVLVAVDDVPWLDPASASALAFAARRLDRDAVRFLFASRDGSSSPLERAFQQATLRRLELRPLSLGATRHLLSERHGLRFSRRVSRRVLESAGGNPLFALELGRMLTERGAAEIGEEMPVPPFVEQLMGPRVARLARGTRRLLLALALSPDLRAAQIAAIASPDAIQAAVDDGLLVIDGDRVRPSHPLLAEAALARATSRERRALHLELARATADDELRAHHLALGTEHPDEELAALVSAGAARAGSRGAAGDAVELATHALRLTPRSSAGHSERLLDLAERLLVAGEHERASELLASGFDGLPAGSARARAHLLQAESDGRRVPVEESGTHLRQALAQSADDPTLHARAMASWSRYLAVGPVQHIWEAERSAVDALPDARRAGPAVEREVLHALAFARKLRGLPIDDLSERFEAVSPDAFHLQRGVERIAADRLGTRGHVREARAAFRRLLVLADDRGEAWSSMWLLLQLCELELRAGEWEAAAQLLAEWEESPDHSLIDERGYERCRALLAAGRGEPAEAERLAAGVIEACEELGWRWNLLEALRARGLAALLAHEPARAAESFRTVWAHTEREGVEEPAEFPVAPDLVEALVELGLIDEARVVTDRLRELSEAQEHPWGLATAKRCDALVSLAGHRDATALVRLGEAADAYERLGLRFDHARTLLAAGRAARRLRKWSVARGLLERAATAFAVTGSPGWADDARAELARVGARRPVPAGALTLSERRAAEMAAAGLSNKEIAHTLVVSGHTVEIHLAHAFAKLGVRSRSQLAGHLRDGG